MSPFGFATAGEIAFGPGVRSRLGAAARALGARAFLVTGRDAARAGWADAALRAEGLAVVTHPCAGEPTIDDARAAVASARAFRADVIVAVGGGAALDLGKAVAGLLGADDPMEHLEVVGRGRPLTIAPAPAIAVPTTAGTGSEVTRNAVLGALEHGRKVSLRDPRMLPRLALVDPDLLAGLPHGVALASGLDALVQGIEAYLSRMANPLTDALCRDAVPRGLGALPRLLDGDAGARSDMALSSLFAGLALANSKLGAIHGLSGVIGGRSGGAHGALCGRLAPAVLSLTEAALPAGHPAAARCAEVRGWIAAALGGGPVEGWETLRRFVDDRGLPSLAALGFDPAQTDEIAAEALKASSTQGAPEPPTAEMLARALRAA
jgi:alcohol dehydrogenase class IV